MVGDTIASINARQGERLERGGRGSYKADSRVEEFCNYVGPDLESEDDYDSEGEQQREERVQNATYGNGETRRIEPVTEPKQNSPTQLSQTLQCTARGGR